MPKKSPMSDYHAFKQAAESSNSIKELLAVFDLRAAGGNYSRVRYWAGVHGIPLPVFDSADSIKTNRVDPLPDEQVFVVDSTYSSRQQLKKRLIRLGWAYECSMCLIKDEWNGKPMSLHLDHINGVFNDNRLVNLRFLCPNCHSQTETYSGKKAAYVARTVQVVRPRRKRSFQARPEREKIVWPSANELRRAIEEEGFSATGRRLGVSDNAVRKRLSRKLPE